MKEEIIKKVRELYDNLMYYPNKVLEIFNDFYGEDRVDMQGFLNFDEFLEILKYKKLNSIFPNIISVINAPEFTSSTIENKEIIRTLLDSDILEKTVLEDDNTVNYFLPIINSTLASTLPRGFILVHFPMTRVTNEHDRYVDVPHLWIKVGITVQGKSVGFFGVNRSEYTIEHMKSGYMHSHVSGINWGDTTKFSTPCLGTGPIKSTLATLAIGYDEAIWQLFCLELDKYVKVESLEGVPYRYLEKIGSNNNNMAFGLDTYSMTTTLFSGFYSGFKKEDLSMFIKSFINSKKLKFNFINNSWGIAISYINFTILVSNSFIEWYNKRYNEVTHLANYTDLLRRDILRKSILVDNKIKYLVIGSNNSARRKYYSYEGKPICTFKGKEIKLHIIDNNITTEDNMSLFLNPGIIDIIVRAILEILNYKYGREERNNEAGISSPADYL